MIVIIDEGYDVTLKRTYKSAYSNIQGISPLFIDRDGMSQLTFSNFKTLLSRFGEIRVYDLDHCSNDWTFKVVIRDVG